MITKRKTHRVKRLGNDRFRCATCGAIVPKSKAFIICEKDQLCTCVNCVEQGQKEVLHV
jgi:hypothetical protein